MAARKKENLKAPAVSAEREFVVVLEDLRSQFKVFGEALQGLNEKVDSGFAKFDARFDQIDVRFAQVDARFDQIDARFAQVDARFDQIDGRFEQVDREIGLVKAAVLEHGRDIREIRATVTRIEGALEKKVDRDEVVAIVERTIAGR